MGHRLPGTVPWVIAFLVRYHGSLPSWYDSRGHGSQTCYNVMSQQVHTLQIYMSTTIYIIITYIWVYWIFFKNRKFENCPGMSISINSGYSCRPPTPPPPYTRDPNHPNPTPHPHHMKVLSRIPSAVSNCIGIIGKYKTLFSFCKFILRSTNKYYNRKHNNIIISYVIKAMALFIAMCTYNYVIQCCMCIWT